MALAVADRRLDAAAAFDAALLEEIYQAELWGEDAEAAQRRTGLKKEIAAATSLLDLLRDKEQ